MHQTRRNIFYDVKKQSNKRADPHFNPNSEEDDIRAENQRLRAKIRSQQTDIIRLQAKIDNLQQKIDLASTRNSMFQTNKQQTIKEAVNSFSGVPMILQNKELKQMNQILHQQSLALNGKNNELQAELRQLKSDKYQMELKIKQFGVLQKMREERFKDQVDRLTPIIIEEPSDFTIIKRTIKEVYEFMRKKVTEVAEHLFMMSAKDCQANKKMNSFTIFLNYWSQLKARKNYGYGASISAYKSVKKIMKIIDENYDSIDREKMMGTIDEWVLDSIVQIKNMPTKQEERKLFRLLGVKYRLKFPIKGQKHEVEVDTLAYLQNMINWQVDRLLFPRKQQKQIQQGE